MYSTICNVKPNVYVYRYVMFIFFSFQLIFFQLSDTRTLDKSWTLLHFIVETIETQFPALVNFDDELTGVVEAAKG